MSSSDAPGTDATASVAIPLQEHEKLVAKAESCANWKDLALEYLEQLENPGQSKCHHHKGDVKKLKLEAQGLRERLRAAEERVGVLWEAVNIHRAELLKTHGQLRIAEGTLDLERAKVAPSAAECGEIDEVIDLRRKLRTTKNLVDMMRVARDNYCAELDGKERELEELATDLTKERAYNVSLAATVNGLNRACKDLRDVADAAHDTANKANGKVGNLTGEIRMLVGQLEKAKSALVQSQEQEATSLRRLGEAREELALVKEKLGVEIVGLAAQVVELTAQLADAQLDAEVIGNMGAIIDSNVELEGRLAQVEVERDHARRQRNDLQAKLDRTRGVLSE